MLLVGWGEDGEVWEMKVREEEDGGDGWRQVMMDDVEMIGWGNGASGWKLTELNVRLLVGMGTVAEMLIESDVIDDILLQTAGPRSSEAGCDVTEVLGDEGSGTGDEAGGGDRRLVGDGATHDESASTRFGGTEHCDLVALATVGGGRSTWELCKSVQHHYWDQSVDILPYDDVTKWKHFLRYWPFVRGIHWSPLKSPTKASDAELWCFLWSTPEQTVEQTIETPVVWEAIALIMT